MKYDAVPHWILYISLISGAGYRKYVESGSLYRRARRSADLLKALLISVAP